MLAGHIEVQSVIEVGSKFTLVLPISEKKNIDVLYKEKEKSIKLREKRDKERGTEKKKRKLVLVIDDEEEVRKSLMQFLEEEEFRVVLAEKGKRGLELSNKLKPDAIILDVFIPEKDGWEVLYELKKESETAEIPVIILTVSQDKATGMALGANGFLTKPVKKQVLLSELKRIRKKGKVENVLVVDDDLATRRLIRQVLEECDCRVKEAEGGQEGIRIALEEPIPDLMILDIIMPDMDGITVLEKIRSNSITKDIHTIIITAKDLSEKEQKQLLESAEKIILKQNITQDALFHEITKVLFRLGRAGREEANMRRPILVVEDNPDNVTTIAAILQEVDEECVVAVDGIQAVQYAKVCLPKLILMDIQLPGINGLVATKKIKAEPGLRDIPIIAITARAMKGEKERILESGCDDYLSKPIKPKWLLKKVRKWLYQ